jgi:hypothetical protein
MRHVPFQVTGHALRRAHQRAVRVSAIDFVLKHADTSVPVGGGCQCHSLSSSALAAIPDTEAPPALREQARGLAVLTDADGTTVITVLRPHGRRGRRYRHRFPNRRPVRPATHLH